MLNRFSVNFVVSCFIFSMVFVAGGCAKKPQVAPAEEKTLGGSSGGDTSGQAKGGEFKEMDVASTSGEFVKALDLATIYFDFDQYNIRPNDKELLNKNAEWITTYKSVIVRIEGHCDSRGTSDYNLALGDKRANVTKDYLTSLGINPSRITTVSYGEEKPVCAENNESCWVKNRRAEFFMAR